LFESFNAREDDAPELILRQVAKESVRYRQWQLACGMLPLSAGVNDDF
jgi:hypothetical protein